MALPSATSDLESLLEHIKSVRGFDFTGYKRPSLQRRFAKRMQAVRAESFEAYRDYLDAHPDEFVELFNTILINVTSFFRDAPAWDYLRREVVPRIVEEAQARDSIRVWSTGCASGEEAYSLAICFAEALSEAEVSGRVKIYATDIDGEALAEGRHGVYASAKLENVPDDLRTRYFERHDHHWIVAAPLRRAVIFGRHDIVHDPPISRIDLLASRNTLIYFTPETQQGILANFHFALQPSGYLFLGKSERMLGRSTLFTPVDVKRRVFQKLQRVDGQDAARRLPPDSADLDGRDKSIRDAGFETAPVAQLVVDRNGNVTLANLQARTLFNLGRPDIGRPLRELDVSYKPVELRTPIEQAYSERRAIAIRDIEWNPQDGDPRVMDIQVAPLLAADGALVGVGISFVDVTRYKRLQDSVEESKHVVETAYEELQSTTEELETTNEELQSTNEELETTNEELQTTNEELETKNEELQSTNEELETINDELNQRTEELHHTNFFLESILAGLEEAVVVLDRELRVAAWNDGARALWGLLPEEVHGRHFMNLDIGLPLDQLRGGLRAALAGEPTSPFAVEATDRRGRPISCRTRITSLNPAGSGTAEGVILFMKAESA